MTLGPYGFGANCLSASGGAREPAFHCVCVHKACLLEMKLSAAKYGEVGNALHVETCGKFGMFLCVYLQHHGVAGILTGNLRNMRAAMRQGPHHEAQKSTSTGTWLSRTISSNSPGVTSMGSEMGGSADLQAPHFPVSEICFAGIRFWVLQEGHLRTMGIRIFPFKCSTQRISRWLQRS